MNHIIWFNLSTTPENSRRFFVTNMVSIGLAEVMLVAEPLCCQLFPFIKGRRLRVKIMCLYSDDIFAGPFIIEKNYEN